MKTCDTCKHGDGTIMWTGKRVIHPILGHEVQESVDDPDNVMCEYFNNVPQPYWVGYETYDHFKTSPKTAGSDCECWEPKEE